MLLYDGQWVKHYMVSDMCFVLVSNCYQFLLFVEPENSIPLCFHYDIGFTVDLHDCIGRLMK